MSEDRLPSAFTFKIQKRGHIDEPDIPGRIEYEYQCLIKFYEDNTSGPERDFLLHDERAKIQQSDKISDITKDAAKLFYKISDIWKTYLAQNRVLSLGLIGKASTLIAESGAFWTRVDLGPHAERGAKVIKGASLGGKERNRADEYKNDDLIKKELNTFLADTKGILKGKKLFKQAIAKIIAEKTGDSYKTVERVCSKELKPYIRPRKTT